MMNTPKSCKLGQGDTLGTPFVWHRVQEECSSDGDGKGVSVRRVAREIDIHPNLNHKWRREYLAEVESALVGTRNVNNETAEVKRL